MKKNRLFFILILILQMLLHRCYYACKVLKEKRFFDMEVYYR